MLLCPIDVPEDKGWSGCTDKKNGTDSLEAMPEPRCQGMDNIGMSDFTNCGADDTLKHHSAGKQAYIHGFAGCIVYFL